MNFLEKLDHLKEKYNLNNHTLAQASGIPYTTIDGFYKRGYERLRLDTVQKVADYFNVSIDYLTRDDIEDPNADRKLMALTGDEELEMITKYRALSPHAQETIRLLIDREYEALS